MLEGGGQRVRDFLRAVAPLGGAAVARLDQIIMADRQRDRLSCWASSLQMGLHHELQRVARQHGLQPGCILDTWIVERLRGTAGSSAGSPADILAVSGPVGVETGGASWTAEVRVAEVVSASDVHRRLHSGSPALLWIDGHPFAHVVVAVAIDRNALEVIDPGTGTRRVLPPDDMISYAFVVTADRQVIRRDAPY